ncbi:hypothetical protein A7976_09765 [Methylobacillus sp. MM3]|uniref:hypothetical protein n=1 Tax=Methylobacillus sp. MM3 TaxID=1848039 RepID=UPI0007DF3089|nr:hypothetical protein [Methylobacillus sp. MM3]OAJ71753.1 hypothetical protein A7976_09765 [Methylobacillus sp. MM3]
MKKLAAVLALFACSGLAQAKPAFTGPDYSGVYECTGLDAHEGKYTGTVTMKLVPEQSTGDHGAYGFKLEVPEYGAYLGHAVAEGNKLAIHFALKDPSTKDYGTGIATIKKGKDGKLAFSKFYYEPEYKGGNTGSEECAQK